MFDLVQRIHTLTDVNNVTVIVHTVSVHDTDSQSKRVGNAEALMQDARNALKSKSEAVVARIGIEGGIFKLAAYLNAGYIPQPTTYTVVSSHNTREEAEKARGDYLKDNAGTEGLVGSASFSFIRNGNGGGGMFHQPISGDTARAVERIKNTIENVGLTLDLTPMEGARFDNGFPGGIPFSSLSSIIISCAAKNKDYDPSHSATVNGVIFEQGEFKNYGQLYRKLMQANIIF